MVTKYKMDNPRFADEETIPLVQDEDYHNYGTEYKQDRRDIIYGTWYFSGNIDPTLTSKSKTR